MADGLLTGWMTGAVNGGRAFVDPVMQLAGGVVEQPDDGDPRT
jgi:hypothetical protein